MGFVVAEEAVEEEEEDCVALLGTVPGMTTIPCEED